MTSTNLQEIIMDGSVFTCGDNNNDIKKISDLENHPLSLLFHYVNSWVVEQISIRRAKFHDKFYPIDPLIIKQIKLQQKTV